MEQYYLQNSIKCLGFYASCSIVGHLLGFLHCIVTELVQPDPPEPFMKFIVDQQIHFGFMV